MAVNKKYRISYKVPEKLKDRFWIGMERKIAKEIGSDLIPVAYLDMVTSKLRSENKFETRDATFFWIDSVLKDSIENNLEI
jgi:hypothetical protein